MAPLHTLHGKLHSKRTLTIADHITSKLPRPSDFHTRIIHSLHIIGETSIHRDAVVTMTTIVVEVVLGIAGAVDMNILVKVESA